MSGPPGPGRRDEIIESLAGQLLARNMTATAIFLLQLHAPLAFLGSQFLLAAQPFISVVTGDRLARDLAWFWQEPENIERLIARLERG